MSEIFDQSNQFFDWLNSLEIDFFFSAACIFLYLDLQHLGHFLIKPIDLGIYI